MTELLCCPSEFLHSIVFLVVNQHFKMAVLLDQLQSDGGTERLS